jgi:signal peptidase II
MTDKQPTHRSAKIALPTILGLAAVIFGLDQLTKYLVLRYIPLEGAWSYLPGLSRLFRITFIKNTGAAFGMFPQMGTVLMAIAVIVIVAIIFFHHNLPVENILVRACLGLQLGGAMGNLMDRIVHGYVVDFVDIGFWPIFNVADSAIVIGVSILAYFLWQEENEPTEPITASGEKEPEAAQKGRLPAEVTQAKDLGPQVPSLTKSGNL